ncbi:long-chain fatty acid--CoA ligase [Roseomonas oryzicola]|uniref:Long-chain fatty acid--CoA ligase n=1 Tax=Neoroseomonas oryzicola TaxID=535904 RepID=A0A9X9WE74_9PROT|nr:long-chain fatty acid--CoA ligase [Neoroseomonas oryzicola]NKE17930.1 long-chain fatty acid--CoA ligase [Neoroseomonas oryzicola]
MDADGYATIVDRKKHMIRTAGFNVCPAELERVLRMHPAVALAAVGGIPDAAKGELATAHVIRRAGATVTANELIAHCRECLAACKVPRALQFEEAVPMAASVKIMRRMLAAIDDGSGLPLCEGIRHPTRMAAAGLRRAALLAALPLIDANYLMQRRRPEKTEDARLATTGPRRVSRGSNGVPRGCASQLPPTGPSGEGRQCEPPPAPSASGRQSNHSRNYAAEPSQGEATASALPTPNRAAGLAEDIRRISASEKPSLSTSMRNSRNASTGGGSR